MRSSLAPAGGWTSGYLTPFHCDVSSHTAVHDLTPVDLGPSGSVWYTQSPAYLVRTISVGQHLPTTHSVQYVAFLIEPLHLHRPRVKSSYVTCDRCVRGTRGGLFNQHNIWNCTESQ